jgi:hypothetical protein
VTPSLFHVASTYWKQASGTSPLDLPLVGVLTFLEGLVALPDRVQVEDSSGSHGALSSLQAPGSALQRLDVRLRLRPGGFFFFGNPCTLRKFITVTSSPCFDVTSSLPLRLHVDRGLVRHGYPWVLTDQGLRGLCQVDLTCQKTSRPTSGAGDLIRSPGDLGRPWATLSRSRATCRACGASLS